MRELTKGEVQDRLPDLLHERLSAEDATSMERALAADPELAAEFALLRSVRDAMESHPAVDVSRILAALPSTPARAAAEPVDELALRRAARLPLVSPRFARAAALLVMIGGGTLVSVYRSSGFTGPNVLTPVTSESSAVAAGPMQLGLGAYTDDLTVDQLRALEADIRSLDGIPSAELEGNADLLTSEGA
jgi:anti-sigma factor RsiW